MIFEFFNDDRIDTLEHNSVTVALNHGKDLAIINNTFVSVYVWLEAVAGNEDTKYLQFLGSFSGSGIHKAEVSDAH